MRKVLFICLVLPVIGFGQGLENYFPMVNGSICYTEVVPLDSIPAKELYKRAKLWIANSYKSYKAVTDLDDLENTTYMGNGSVVVYLSSGTEAYIRHKIKIETKDGRYKYTFNNLMINYFYSSQYGSGEANEPLETWQVLMGKKRVWTDTNTEMILLVESLKKHMRTESIKKDDSW